MSETNLSVANFTVGQRVEVTVPVLIIKAGATGKIRAILTDDLVTVEIDKHLVPRAMGCLVGLHPKNLKEITAQIFEFKRKRAALEIVKD